MEQLSESTLLSRLVAERHQFLGFLERRLGDRALAEDILQEAFARSLSKLEQIDDRESGVAWFYRVLRNAVIDHRRRNAAAQRKLAQLERELETSEPELHSAVCQCVTALVRSLKPEYAAALQAVEIEGAAVKDFATTTGISSSNAAVRVFRARDALRRQVARCCGSCADDGCRDCTCHAGPLEPPAGTD